MDEVLIEQEVAISAIRRSLESFKKRPQTQISAAFIQGRMKHLQQQWNYCQRLDVKLNILTANSDKSLILYFSNDDFKSAEDVYLKTLDYFNEQIAKLNEEAANALNNGNTREPRSLSSVSEASRIIKLPRIDLPKFSGEYLEWRNFKDLFQSLIASNATLPNVQKMHYLKSSLEGEAAQLIKHMCTTAENYESAWNTLIKRYENERVLINSYWQSFMSIPIINQETVQNLKNLRNITAEAVQGLKNLERPINDDLLVFVIVQKLNKCALIDWEKHLSDKTEYPTYEELDSFLTTRIRSLEALESTKGHQKQQTSKSDPMQNRNLQRESTSRTFNISLSNTKCVICEDKHALYRCENFKALSIIDRKALVKEKHLCFNCLRMGHNVGNCRSKNTCQNCKRRHHTMLHFNNKNTNLEVNIKRNEEPSYSNHNAKVVLATAKILVRAENGRESIVRALLDQGSETTFVSENLAQLLHAKKYPQMVKIETIDNIPIGKAKSGVMLTVSSVKRSNYNLTISALVLPRISGYQLPKRVNYKNWDHLVDLELADPEPFKRGDIEILIGSDYYGSLLLEGLRKGPPGSLTAQATEFGWIISGPINETKRKGETLIGVHHAIKLTDLEQDLNLFWNIEETPRQTFLTDDEKRCEEHFIATHSRTSEGRYVVRLPLKTDTTNNIGDSLNIAKRMLIKTERRLQKEPKLQEDYYNFLREYKKLHHMSEVLIENENGDTNKPIVYLPHFPVIKENSTTTRVRVVFNASCQTSTGVSLNDHLLPGPKLQNDIVSIILRWRQYEFVMTADICKMFRQILLDPRDVDYQRIVCKLSPTAEIQHFRLLTVTYGMTTAPYLANRVLKQLAQDEGFKHPEAKRLLERDFYVDDVLFGADEEITVLKFREELIQLLQKGGFTLTNQNDSDNKQNSDLIYLTQTASGSQALLGLLWCPKSDCFQLSVSKQSYEYITKRIVLSLISKLFDPLGWVTPIIITVKILMQEIWLRKLEWDEKLPEDILLRWENYYSELPIINNLFIQRWTGLKKEQMFELHGFADASEVAYAGAVYVKTFDPQNKIRLTLILAKSKVAPLKTKLTIPKLELCAVILLSKLLQKTIEELGIDLGITKVYGWTDSTIVLGWLSKHPSLWPTFVANRVADVNSMVPSVKWRYVPTKENPADCASRGIFPKELLQHKLWWQGPTWLQEPIEKWPENKIEIPRSKFENQKVKVNAISVNIENTPFEQLLERSSNWPKLLRVTAFLFRFIELCKIKGSPNPTVCIAELQKSRILWLGLAQKQYFSDEIDELLNERPIKNTSKLKSLCPFIDKDNLLRVKGRMENAPISWDAKHPIILPNNRLSQLIVEQTHLRTLHGGLQLTLFTLRQNFWILRAKNLVRKVINNCVICTRQRATQQTQLMGELPSAKVTPSNSFSHTGLDYAGPIDLRTGKGRGRSSHKGYICLFICLATRAVHLEVVSDCSTSGFLSTLKRFLSRRGIPSDLYSDNGRNFHGANKELRRAFLEVTKSDQVQNYISQKNIVWHFNPPSAPHFGGMWEAGVKSVKYHLKRIIGPHKLTYEELSTLMCEIEACLNSRPIGALSTDPDDYSYLTPGHFLIGAPLIAIPEKSLLNENKNRLTRWQIVKRKSDHFWKRWCMEYPQSLQHRYKWTKINRNLKEGDLVIIRDANTPKTKWSLGRITRCYPGSDSLVRVVSVKTATTEYKRPITQLCKLPVLRDDSNEN